MKKTDPSPGLTREERERLPEIRQALGALREGLHRRIVGQDAVVTQILVALLAEGHCLMVGVPGLAKTLLISSLSELLSLRFKRIQFTPDLMPSDITGASIISEQANGERGFQFLQGPIFANLLLADEINRTPPKTQAALMEAMEERQVSVGGRRRSLERPFFVLATQNPIEQKGTYPLPVSQLDRFLFNITIDYPTTDEEFRMLVLTTSTYKAEVQQTVSREEVLEWIDVARRIRVGPEILDYGSRLVRATRPDSETAPAFVRDKVAWGGGPRATQALVAAARAMALLDGRDHVTYPDIHEVALPSLRHRILLSYHSTAEGVKTEEAIFQVLESLPGGHFKRESAVSHRPKQSWFARLVQR